MTTTDDEGADFLASFGAGRKDYGAGERSKRHVEERAQRERRAGMSTAQRQRKGPPTKQVNFRATAETQAHIAALAAHLNTSATEVIARALAELATAMLKGGKG